MKRLSIFFAALMACTLSFAAEVTYDFTTNDWKLPTDDYTKTAATYTNADGYSISFGKSNSGHKFVGTYLIFGKSGATLTFNSLNKNVTSVAITGNKGASTAVTWTFSANSTQIGDAQTGAQGTYTFDIPAAQQAADNTYTIKVTNGKNMQITKVVFTYESADPDAIDKPTFTPADGDFVGSVEVTLAAGEGLDIYYTLDGTDPTTASTKYTAPFTLTETKTVKAIAYNATTKKASAIAEKTYTAQKLMTCAEANKAAEGTSAFLGEVTVAYAQGDYTYVMDETGYILLYKSSINAKVGQTITGINGTIDNYKGLPQIANATSTAQPQDGGKDPVAKELTAAPTKDILNQYVVLKGAQPKASIKFTENGEREQGNVTFGENAEVIIYNRFQLVTTLSADSTYDIYGFVSIFGDDIQVYVTEARANGVGTSVDDIRADVAVEKIVRNGQVFIIRDGNIYNLMGQVVE